jgi:1,4-alpha-glucan branching enzyme
MEKTGKNRTVKSRRITFSIEAANAGKVYLAGEFNDWNPAKSPMKKSADGKWKKQISLPPGEFEYKFLVDDQWIEDPQNDDARPNCFGTWNSLIHITT